MDSVPPPGFGGTDDAEPGLTVAGTAGELQRQKLDRRRARRGPEATPDAYDVAHEKGLAGEVRVAAELERCLTGSECILINSVRFLGFGDIDHIVVGPGGITVIDAKNWTGPVTVGGGVPKVAGRGRGKEITKLCKQVTGVRLALLNGPPALRNTSVRGVMCLAAEPDRPAADLQQGLALGGSRAAAQIAARPGALNAGRIAFLQQVLIDELPRVRSQDIEELLAPAIPLPPTAPPRRTQRPARRNERTRKLIREAVVTLAVAGLALWTIANLRFSPAPVRRAIPRTVSALQVAQRAQRLIVRFTASAGPIGLWVEGDGRPHTAELIAAGAPEIWEGPRIGRRTRQVHVTICLLAPDGACRPSGATVHVLTTRALTIRRAAVRRHRPARRH